MKQDLSDANGDGFFDRQSWWQAIVRWFTSEPAPQGAVMTRRNILACVAIIFFVLVLPALIVMCTHHGRVFVP